MTRDRPDGPEGIRHLLRRVSVYTVATMLNRSVPIMLVPILTRYLSPTDYGVVALFNVALGVAAPIVGLGTMSSVRRRYFDDKIDFPDYVSSSLITNGIAIAFLALLLAPLAPVLANEGNIPAIWVWTIVPVLAGRVLNSLCLAIFQLEKQTVRFGALQISGTALNLGLSLIFVAGLGYGWEGRISGQVLSITAVGALSLVLILRRYRLVRPRLTYMKDALSYGLPIVPTAIVVRLVASADRAVIIFFLGLDIAGIYSVGYQAASLLYLLVEALMLAWTPWAFAQLKSGTEKGQLAFVRASYLCLGGILAAGALLVVAAYVALPWAVGEAFHSAVHFVPWLTLGLCFQAASRIFTTAILFDGRNTVLSMLAGVVLVVNLVLSCLAAMYWDAVGVAVATTVSFAVNALLTALAARKINPLPWGEPFRRRRPSGVSDG